jgi:hypothetical protein
VVPRGLALLHADDVEALCARETVVQALVLAVRFLHQSRACVVTEPAEAGETSARATSRVYFRVGAAAEQIFGDTSGGAADPDQMISAAVYPGQLEQWRNYQMASSVAVCHQLRLALLQQCLATAMVGRDPITKHITKPYPVMFPSIRWSDISAALTLWWWHHAEQGYTPAAASTMLALLTDPSLAAHLTYPEDGSAPVLAPPPAAA